MTTLRGDHYSKSPEALLVSLARKSERDAFEELIRRFPDTEYAEDAAKRMIYLRNNLARHEIHVARYYADRGAWLAAANRAQYVVQNYQRTPAVKDALAIMLLGKRFNRRKAFLLLGIYALFLVFVGTQVGEELQQGIGKPIGEFLKSVADLIGSQLR